MSLSAESCCDFSEALSKAATQCVAKAFPDRAFAHGLKLQFSLGTAIGPETSFQFRKQDERAT